VQIFLISLVQRIRLGATQRGAALEGPVETCRLVDEVIERRRICWIFDPRVKVGDGLGVDRVHPDAGVDHFDVVELLCDKHFDISIHIRHDSSDVEELLDSAGSPRSLEASRATQSILGQKCALEVPIGKLVTNWAVGAIVGCKGSKVDRLLLPHIPHDRVRLRGDGHGDIGDEGGVATLVVDLESELINKRTFG